MSGLRTQEEEVVPAVLGLTDCQCQKWLPEREIRLRGLEDARQGSEEGGLSALKGVEFGQRL